MPTGYTAPIEEGEISFRDFAMGCARAFGALIMMRDAGSDAKIPEVIEPDDWHKKQIKVGQARLRKLASMTTEEANAAAEVEYQKRLKQQQEETVKEKAIEARYVAMLAEVEQWEPPTDEHTEIKKFMRDQITMCMRDGPGYWENHKPKRLTGEAWLKKEKALADQGLVYDRKHWDIAVARAAERTKWVNTLRDSLPQPEPTNRMEIAETAK